MSTFEHQSLLGALRAAVARKPETPVVFPESGVTLPVSGLLTAAETFAKVLVGAGVGPGELVGQLTAAGPHVLAGLFGVTGAGAAVSMLPNLSALREPARTADHVASLVSASGLRVLLFDEAHREVAGSVKRRHPDLTVLELTPETATEPSATNDADPADKPASGNESNAANKSSAPHGVGESPGLPSVRADDVAVVQYTSGSVSRPKGVVLRHRTVLAGLNAIATSSRITADDVLVHWLPHYHDMGLFGWLAALLSGAATHTFSPAAFIRRPASFLRHLSRHGGTLTSGPNFGYDLLLEAVDDAEARELDLRSWRLAYNGAEPVSPATVEAFARRFGQGIMYPVYGMAEATLAVTFPEPGSTPRILHVDRDTLARTGHATPANPGPTAADPAGPGATPADPGAPVAEAADPANSSGTPAEPANPADPGVRSLVAVGKPVEGLELRIVDDAGKPQPERALGEIQIRGAAVTDGYREDPAATAAAFDRDWLRTGDLGFLADGELYIAGRVKEMIIVNGENYFAEDVEHLVRDLPGVYRRHCVALPETAERMTVIVEGGVDHDGLAERVRAEIAKGLGLNAVHVHVIEPGGLPRTTSGKWQRARAGAVIRR